MNFTVKKYKVKDINLNVAEIGKGEPLIFIHGWSNNWIGWTLLAEKLAPHYKLYLVDLPGFGDSGQLEKYSLEIVASYVGEFIKQYVPHPKAIIGGSGGTFVAAQTLEQISLDTAPIFIGTLFKNKRIEFLTKAYEKVLEFSSERESAQKIFEKIIKHPYSAYFIEKYLNAYQFNKQLVDAYQIPGRKKITGKSYVQLGLSFMSFYMDEFLHNTNLPTLLLFGDKDKYVTPKIAQDFVSQLSKPNISLDFVKNAGHSPAYEQPQETAQIILDFLRKVD